MRRILHLMLAVSATMVCALSSAAAGPSILFDSRTGQVIESDRPFDRWYPASLTKLMTTYVAFRMVETGEVTTTPASFTPRRRPQRIVSTDEVAAATGESSVLLVNALDRESFAGGHIPGSVNVPFAELVDDAGRLRPLEELRELFADVGALDPSVRPVTYCGGGIAATAAAFALHSLGRDDVAVYDGSMNAWTADPARPLS